MKDKDLFLKYKNYTIVDIVLILENYQNMLDKIKKLESDNKDLKDKFYQKNK